VLLRRSSGEDGCNSCRFGREATLVPKLPSCTGERHGKPSLDSACVGGVSGNSHLTEGQAGIPGLELRPADGRGDDAKDAPRISAWISDTAEEE
jgi:hypothetical protein